LTSCRYDRDTKTHLTRAHQPDCTDTTCRGCQPCTTDDHGNPTRHCRVRTRCTSHLGWTEHACPVCLSKIRANLTRIITALAAMPAELEEVGRTDRTAAAYHLPGATAHPGAWLARMRHNDTHGRHTEDADEGDPWQMLAVRERTIRKALAHDHLLVSPSLAGTCGYLAWVLTDLARDPEHVPTLTELHGETSRLADHLEAILRDSRKPERGAPCRSCPAPAPRLQLEPGHWCTEANCHRQHHADDSDDRWVCPANPDHWWTAADYRRWVYADAHALNA
jgi:hypothetical protein